MRDSVVGCRRITSAGIISDYFSMKPQKCDLVDAMKKVIFKFRAMRLKDFGINSLLQIMLNKRFSVA